MPCTHLSENRVFLNSLQVFCWCIILLYPSPIRMLAKSSYHQLGGKHPMISRVSTCFNHPFGRSSQPSTACFPWFGAGPGLAQRGRRDQVGAAWSWLSTAAPTGKNHGPSRNHQTWLENPRTEWRLIARKISDKWSIFQQAIFDYRRLD